MLYGIVLAAGKSNRLKSKTKKQFIKINDKPVLCYSIDKLLKIKKINKIIIVLNSKDKNNLVFKSLLKKYKNEFNIGKLCIVLGGKERYDSVYNALKFINDYIGIEPSDNVIIHDSARPNVSINDIKNLIVNIDKYKAITLGYKLSDSIKQIKNNVSCIKEVSKSLNRDLYYLISTPQGFNLNLLYNCYNKFKNNKNNNFITDDLQIIEYYSKKKTYVLDSSKLNFKITTQDDLNMIKYLI